MIQFGKTAQEPIHLYETAYTPNALNEQQIKEIIELGEKLTPSPAQVGGGLAGRVDEHTRRSNTSWINPDVAPNWVARYFEELFLAVSAKHFGFELTGIESLQYTVYNEKYSGEYKWHNDTAFVGTGIVRKLSMSILLSDEDEYAGGRLILAPQGNPIVAEEKKGQAIFFPSWTPHCVTPIMKGTRKSLVIWAHGPAFK